MSDWRPITKTSLWKRLLPTWLHGPTVLLFQIGLALGVVGLGIGFFYFILASKFDLDEVTELPRGNVFFDRSGKEIEAVGGSGREIVTRSQIPEFLVLALTAREDARFFEHGGVDFRGMARATVRNIKDRDFTQGASTLTMQLARNTYEMRAKSLHRKALEVALTLRIESRFTKDEILTNYLNRIYFGSGAYGVEEAAQTYFGKSVTQLHPGECAMIVGIIRGPHIFSPLRNFSAAENQRNQTLKRMVDAGFLTEERAIAVKDLEIRLAENDGNAGNQVPYVFGSLRRELESVMEKKGSVLNGLNVYTTLDLAWQHRMKMELSATLSQFEGKTDWDHPKYSDYQIGEEPKYIQCAAVTIDTDTGAVLAFMGGRDASHSRYDRTRAKRDMGSVFEPFVAAAASERGKLVFPNKPVQTGRQIGPKEMERLARRCGFSGPFLQTEDLFRGAIAASPMEVSIGLAILANKGKKSEPYFISKITDSGGNVLYEVDVKRDKVLSESAAEEALDLLRKQSATRCYTGATASERDGWVLRMGPSGSTAVWMGFDSPVRISSEERLRALLTEFSKRLEN